MKGAYVTAATGFVGWVTDAIPVLQAASLVVSILVGVATIAWFAYQAYHLKKRSKS